MKKISLVIPAFNEEENIQAFYDLCKETLDSNFKYEYLFIDDGSKDRTWEEIEKLSQNNPSENIIGISFSRNFGKESAILAGLNNATGDYTVLIDADLQQHPRYVNQMTNILDSDDNLDMVACYQDKRIEGGILKKFKDAFYYLINKMSNVKFEKNASDFRMFRKNVKESITDLNEYHRFSKGLFAWVGFNVEYIPYKVESRHSGTTTWSFKSLTKYAIEGFVGYSVIPLRFATFLGAFTTIASIIYLIYVILKKIFIGVDVSGFTTIVSLILVLSGVQLICMGIIGEYLARTYIEGKKRPHYLIKEKIESTREYDQLNLF